MSQQKLQLIELGVEIERIEDRKEYDTDAVKSISNVLDGLNTAYNEKSIEHHVENLDEVVIDAKLLHTAVSLCKEVGKAINIAVNVYSSNEFIENLQKCFNNNGELDIDTLVDRIAHTFRLTPNYTYLYGNIVPKEAPPEQKKRQRTILHNFGEASEPEEISKTLEKEEDLLKIIRKMFIILKSAVAANNDNPIDYYEFVINNEDFAATIQNIFHFSFLVRDGLVKIVAENDQLLVLTVKKSQREAELSSLENKQNVVTLSYTDWEGLVSIYGNKEGIYQRLLRQDEQNKRLKRR